jgi:hypothetical protein
MLMETGESLKAVGGVDSDPRQRVPDDKRAPSEDISILSRCYEIFWCSFIPCRIFFVIFSSKSLMHLVVALNLLGSLHQINSTNLHENEKHPRGRRSS